MPKVLVVGPALALFWQVAGLLPAMRLLGLKKDLYKEEQAGLRARRGRATGLTVRIQTSELGQHDCAGVGVEEDEALSRHSRFEGLALS